MKITAKINDYKFLVELSTEELNKITGENRNSRDGYDARPYKVEQSFNVVKNFDYLKGIFEKKKQLFDMARNFRSMADMIESMPAPEEDKDTDPSLFSE